MRPYQRSVTTKTEGTAIRYDPDKHHRRSIRLRSYDYSLPGAYFVTISTRSKRSLFGEVLDGAVRLNEAGEMVEKWWRATATKFQSIETDEYMVMPDHFHGILINVEGAHTGAPLQDTLAEHSGAPLQDTLAEHSGAPLQDTLAEHSGAPLQDTLAEHSGAPLQDTLAEHSGAPLQDTLAEHSGAPLQDTLAEHTRTPRPGQRAGATLPEVVQWFKTMTTNECIRGVRNRGWTPFAGKLWQRSYYERVIRNEDELNRARQYILDNPAKWSEHAEHPGNPSAG